MDDNIYDIDYEQEEELSYKRKNSLTGVSSQVSSGSPQVPRIMMDASPTL